MEILVIGGVLGFIVLLVVMRSLMTSGERQWTSSGAPHLAEVPSPIEGNTPGGETVSITKVGPKKINVIKVIREYTGLGLKDAKELADAAQKAPVVVANNLSSLVAADFRRELQNAGASVGDVTTSELISQNVVTFQIEWTDVGPRKIEVIKVIREHTSLGLKEAKEATETSSFTVTMTQDRATQFLIALREAGAVANVHGI